MRRLCTPRLLTACVAVAAMAAGDPAWYQEKPAEAVAVIVNAKNEVSDLSLDDLRAYFALDRQFWAGGRRVLLLLRPPGTTERSVLLDKVWRTTDEDLRKRWVTRLFAGEIPAIPASIKTGEKATAAVRQSEGAISVVLAAKIPAGVKVLTIDGKKPGDPGYPLTTKGIP